MYFKEIIGFIEEGECVARREWNGQNMFICKQIPSEVSSDIIPKLQSLPQSAKDILATYGTSPLKYKNQMLLINLITKEASSWVASSSDTFANDWYIYNL